MPQRSISTVIVGRQTLVRTGISSLIEEYSFRVIAAFNSVEDVAGHVFGGNDPELGVVFNPNVERALKEVEDIRARWPNSKIVFLFDQFTPDQFQQFGESSIDGCISLHVSQEILVRTLNLIVLEGARILILEDLPDGAAVREAEPKHARQISPQSHGNGVVDHLKLVAIARDQERTVDDKHRASELLERSSMCLPEIGMLSEREAEILEGLVRGLSNKEIARERNITEATVKVHMKSILRKIHVSNRTQAAIWAIGRRGRSEGAA